MLGDAGLQQGQVGIISAIQRQVRDGLLANHATQSAVRGVHLLGFAGHLHRLLGRSNLESKIHDRFLAYFEVQAGLGCPS